MVDMLEHIPIHSISGFKTTAAMQVSLHVLALSMLIASVASIRFVLAPLLNNITVIIELVLPCI
jgi:hypothetical protein